MRALDNDHRRTKRHLRPFALLCYYNPRDEEVQCNDMKDIKIK